MNRKKIKLAIRSILCLSTYRDLFSKQPQEKTLVFIFFFKEIRSYLLNKTLLIFKITAKYAWLIVKNDISLQVENLQKERRQRNRKRKTLELVHFIRHIKAFLLILWRSEIRKISNKLFTK